MEKRRLNGGTAIFLLVAVLALAAAFVAFSSTGPKGIEERFEDAVGISTEPGSSADTENYSVIDRTGRGESGDGGGFFLEGSPAMYCLILAVLVALCLIAYRTYGRV